MRVVGISQYFWPETFGINALVRALHDQGLEVTVLTGNPNYPEGKIFPGYAAFGLTCENFNGIDVIRLPIFPRGKSSSWRLVLNYFSFIASGFFLGPWLLRSRDFESVFVYAPSPLLQALPAIWLAWIKRAPVVLWVQDLWPESLSATGFIKNRFLLHQVERVVRFIYRHTDRILIPSEAFRKPIERLLDRSVEVAYYPNAFVQESVSEVSDNVLSLADSMKQYFSVVFAGNLGVAQSLETIVDAAEILGKIDSDIRFFLIGSGSQSEWLANQIHCRNLNNIVLAGRYPPVAMPHFYEAASALLVSLRDEPIFAYTIPSKVQGYLAAGRPVIAALNGEGARVVSTAEAGVTCPAGNATALAREVQKLAQMSADERAEIGENARRYAVENFSLDRLAIDLANILRMSSKSHREGFL